VAFWTSISGELIRFVGYAFVDNGCLGRRDESHWRDDRSRKKLSARATVPTTFVDYLKTLPNDAQWALMNINLTDDGLTIAEAIRDGTAIGISVGSLKDGFGTASWVLEGSSPRHRIRGDNIVPGDTADQGSYRSELSGLYGITLGVYALCEFYKINQGAIEVGCDCITALERRFDEAQNSSISAQHFDVILAIRNIRARYPIRWKYRHVKGHQDDDHSIFWTDGLFLISTWIKQPRFPGIGMPNTDTVQSGRSTENRDRSGLTRKS
jgi:hypothetical protein